MVNDDCTIQICDFGLSRSLTNVANAKDVEEAIEEAKALFQTLKSSEESSSISTITPKNQIDKKIRPSLNIH